MNINPLSSPGIKGNLNSNDASRSLRAQQELALPPSATEQMDKTVAISKTKDCHAMIQVLMQPFISTCEEGEICRVALLMEEIASIMQDCVRDRSPLNLSLIDTLDSQQKIPAPELPGQESIVSFSDTSLISGGGNQSQRELPLFSAVAFADTAKQVSFAQSPQSSRHHTEQIQPLIAPGSDTVKSKFPLSFFAKSVCSIGPSKPEAKRMRDAAETAFAEFDTNKDGFLQKEEVLRAVIEFTEKFEDSHISDPTRFVSSLMAEFDKDGDGWIDFKEFLEMVKSPTLAVDKKENIPFLLSQASRLTANIFLSHKHNIENKVEGRKDDWVIHPMSKLHLAWDVLISILIIVIIVTLPLSFGWEEFGNRLLFKTNLAIDSFFLVDLVKSFFSGIVDENDMILLKFKYIVPTYLKGYFIFDLLSSVPLDLIFYLSNFKSGTARHSLKLLKLFRIAKLFRLRRVSQLFNLVGALSLHLEDKLNFRLTDGTTKLVHLFAVVIIAAHWIGCFNFMLVRTHGFPADSWVVYSGLENERPLVQWSWSMFKALAQMILIGFETPPFTSGSCDTFSSWCRIEHWTTLGCLYIGAMFYSVLISSVLSIRQTSNLARDTFEAKIVQVDGYMRMKGLPSHLREEVKKRLSRHHSNRQFYDEEEVLKLISPDHLKKIREFEALQLAKKVPMLADPANEAFKCALAKHLEQTVVYPDQVIFEEREKSNSMYFISSGLVELYVPSHHEDSYTVIGDGCFFGEVSLLQGIKRTTSAKAKTQCLLFKIGKPELLSVLQDFPQVEKFLNGVASSRRRRVQHFVRPSDNPISEEENYDSEDQRTEVFKQSKDRSKAGTFDVPAPDVAVQR